MGKTRRKGGSRRKRGGAFAALQRGMNALHSNLTKVTEDAKREADKAHKATMGMINEAHAKGTAALHQVKKTTHTGLATVQQQAAKAQGALASGAQRVEQQAGQVAKQVGGRRRRHKTHRRKHRRKHRRTHRRRSHRRHRRRTHRRRR